MLCRWDPRRACEYFQRHGGELTRLEVAKAGKAGRGGSLRVAARRADRSMAREEAMIVAGVGCRREASADEIEQVVRMALGIFQLPAERLDAIATKISQGERTGIS